MDLSELYAQKTTIIELKHPVTGSPLYCDDEQKDPATWTLMSKHTKDYKKLSTAFARKAKQLFGDKKLSDLTDEELDQMDELTTQLTIDSTTGFNLFLGGEKLKFKRQAVEEILGNEDLFWLKQQVVIGANDAANFIKA